MASDKLSFSPASEASAEIGRSRELRLKRLFEENVSLDAALFTSCQKKWEQALIDDEVFSEMFLLDGEKSVPFESRGCLEFRYWVLDASLMVIECLIKLGKERLSACALSYSMADELFSAEDVEAIERYQNGEIDPYTLYIQGLRALRG